MAVDPSNKKGIQMKRKELTKIYYAENWKKTFIIFYFISMVYLKIFQNAAIFVYKLWKPMGFF